MKLRRTRVRTLIMLGVAFALIAAACGDDDAPAAPAAPVATAAPVAADPGIELVSLTARCKANPPTEDGRCNNLLAAVAPANAALAEMGDNRRIDLSIIQDNADWGDYILEFELSSDAGQAVDIVVSGHEQIGSWATSGIITDVTAMLANYPEFDDVIESLWESTELNGSRWGVPQDAEARPMYYRKDLLLQLGWTQAEVDSLPARLASGEYTWENMLDTAEEAVVAGVVNKGNGWWHRPKNGPDFLYYYYAAGGDLLVPGQAALVFDKSAALTVYELVGDAVDRDILSSTRLDGDWTNWNTGVATGDVLFWFGGSWQWADWAANFVADLGGEQYLFDNVGFGPIPALEAGTGQPISLTHPLIYMVSSATAADGNADLALQLIAKATTKELNTAYAVTSGHLGILESQSNYAAYTDAVFLSQISPILEFTTFLPNSPFFSAWDEAYFLGIQAAESGTSPADALDIVVAQLINELGADVAIIE